jgi:hypothetical protein
MPSSTASPTVSPTPGPIRGPRRGSSVLGPLDCTAFLRRDTTTYGFPRKICIASRYGWTVIPTSLAHTRTLTFKQQAESFGQLCIDILAVPSSLDLSAAVLCRYAVPVCPAIVLHGFSLRRRRGQPKRGSEVASDIVCILLMQIRFPSSV